MWRRSMRIDLDTLRKEHAKLTAKIEAIEAMLLAYDDSKTPVNKYIGGSNDVNPNPIRQWIIESSDHLYTYTIKQFMDKSANCTCLGYYHRYTCKHIDAVKEYGSPIGFKVLESGEIL
jgi:hypothetical protein